MKNTITKLTSLLAATLALAIMPLHAADKPEAAEGKAKKEAGTANPNRAIPFHGKLASKTDSSITVGTRTFEITSETKLMKDGKPAILADAKVGDEVGGSYQQKDGKMVAKMVRFGPKPEAAGGAEKEKKPKKSEESK
jgi:hypothetical protein